MGEVSPVEHDEHGLPKISRLNAKIATLERRADYLERKLEERGSGPSRDYDRQELAALRDAVSLFEYHRLLQDEAAADRLL